MIDQPKKFDGSEEERLANYESHRFSQVSEDEVVCIDCDVKPWHLCADWPCGFDVPREIVDDSDGQAWDQWMARAEAYAEMVTAYYDDDPNPYHGDYSEV